MTDEQKDKWLGDLAGKRLTRKSDVDFMTRMSRVWFVDENGSHWKPRENWNHWREVEERIIKDGHLWGCYMSQFPFLIEKSYMQSDLATRAKALYLARVYSCIFSE